MPEHNDQTPAKSKKPTLTQDLLRSHNIVYFDEPYAPNEATASISMPEHVNNLRETLLNFSDIYIDYEWKSNLREEESKLEINRKSKHKHWQHFDLLVPNSAYFAEKDMQQSRPSKVLLTTKDLNDIKRVSLQARRLHYDVEDGWMDLLKQEFFKKFDCREHEHHEDW